MKKLFSILLAACMILGLCAPVLATGGETLEKSLLVDYSQWAYVTTFTNYVDVDEHKDEGLFIIQVEAPSVLKIVSTEKIFDDPGLDLDFPNPPEMEIFNLRSFDEYFGNDDDWPMPYLLREGDELDLVSGIYATNSLVEIPGEDRWYFVIIEVVSPSSPLDSASDHFKDDIVRAIGLGLVPENLQNRYNHTTTRVQFCAIAVALYETVTNTEITQLATFPDTTDINARKMGGLEVVTGFPDGSFRQDNPLTRQQAATMLSRLANAIGQPLAPHTATFTDMGAAGSYAIDAIGQMQGSGIMGGFTDGTFRPSGDYRREQSIVTVLRLYDYLAS
jgi:hypothetical protein